MWTVLRGNKASSDKNSGLGIAATVVFTSIHVAPLLFPLASIKHCSFHDTFRPCLLCAFSLFLLVELKGHKLSEHHTPALLFLGRSADTLSLSYCSKLSKSVPISKLARPIIVSIRPVLIKCLPSLTLPHRFMCARSLEDSSCDVRKLLVPDASIEKRKHSTF